MAEDRVWNIVLNSLNSLEKKLDGVAQDVAAMRQASGDLARRVERNECNIDELQVATATHATALDRHDRQLGLIAKLVVGAVLAAIGAIVPQLLKLLGSIQ